MRALVLAYLFSCTAAWAQQGKIDSTEMLTLRIDPQAAHGAAVSQIFSEVEFIPLETTKESLFGNINHFKIIEDKYIIFDYDTKSILIFEKDGKYKTKINANNMQPEKDDKNKTEFYSFFIEKENNTNYIVVFTGPRIFYFDLAGKLVKKIMEKDYPNRYSTRDLKFADPNTIVRPDFLKKKGKDSTYYELGIINKNKDSIGYFPYNTSRYDSDEFWGSGPRFYQSSPNEVFYLNYHSYDIFKVRPASVSLAYHIIFPAANSLPNDFTTNPVYVKKRGEYLRNNPKVFYAISNTLLVGDNLYFKLHSYGWDRSMKKALIYNFKTSELTSVQDLEPDALSYFLPVTDANGDFYDFINRGFQLYENGYFYTNYSSLAMFTFKEQSEGKTTKYPPSLEAYFKTQNKKSNPVLIKLKPKQN